MKKILLIISSLIFMLSFQEAHSEAVVTDAAMPSVTKDAKGTVYIVFARGNKLEYVSSSNSGASFSKPFLIDTINDLFGVAGRGPHIVATTKALVVVALGENGNIYCYTKNGNSNWIKRGKINDVPEVCREGFLSLAANGDSIYAAWLDLRTTQRNKIAGALSVDGGKTWSKNKILYQSPDGVVCPCCRVSVAFGINGINVMFRNNLNGYRNLYLLHSEDGGNNFNATKLGEGNWKLDACPMDGGGIVAHDDGSVNTVWRRADTIYACAPGEKEQMIAKGKNCTIEKVGSKNVYAWIEENNIVCLLPNGKRHVVGEGSFPVLQQLGNKAFMCVWQKNKDVYCKTISL